MAQTVTYSNEVYEFLMFSLAKQVATDEQGQILNADYGDLRDAIVNRSETLFKTLQKWFKENAYEDTTSAPIEFVNKVRKPCGQYTQKDTCNKSSLCGWHRNTCRIRVKPVVEKDVVLRRITKTLRDNEKQRALVLDNRVSPFLSTVLYLEMPHEVFTTTL